ncbi:hypothetical protein Hanom_Chr15g01372661 [Helianthus anomalus]
MERALNGIKLGKCKLKANIAKFATENQESKVLFAQQKKNLGGGGVIPEHVPIYEAVQTNRGAYRFFIPEGGCSYKDVVKASNGVGLRSLQSEMLGNHSEVVVEVPPNTGAFQDLVGKALIGRTKDLPTLIKMDNLLVEAGWVGMEILYVRGLTLMFKFQEVIPFDRLPWIKIYGVPLHLANNEVFDCVAAKFGKIVHLANLNLGNGDLSVACVDIIVGEGNRIDGPVKLKWKDRSFMLRVSEETRDWDQIVLVWL